MFITNQEDLTTLTEFHASVLLYVYVLEGHLNPSPTTDNSTPSSYYPPPLLQNFSCPFTLLSATTRSRVEDLFFSFLFFLFWFVYKKPLSLLLVSESSIPAQIQTFTFCFYRENPERKLAHLDYITSFFFFSQLG